jgi:hypothetical protein
MAFGADKLLDIPPTKLPGGLSYIGKPPIQQAAASANITDDLSSRKDFGIRRFPEQSTEWKIFAVPTQPRAKRLVMAKVPNQTQSMLKPKAKAATEKNTPKKTQVKEVEKGASSISRLRPNQDRNSSQSQNRNRW